MKALVYTAPNVVEYRNEPTPDYDEREALIKVDAVGICGSDLHAYLGHDDRRVPPLILGHEVCGTIVGGSGSGKKAVVNPLITCGKCDDCVNGLTNLCRDRQLIGMNRPGAFADMVSIPLQNLVELSDSADPSILAMTEPAAVSLHAVRVAQRNLSRPVSEGRALVIGGGAVGVFCVYFLKDYGCKDITLAETNSIRRGTIENTDTCEVVDPITDQIENDKYDTVLDAVGNDKTRALAVNAVKPGGVIMHIGLGSADGEVDFRKITLAEVTFIGTYTYTATDFRVAAKKLETCEIGSLDWFDERPMSEGAQAFSQLIQGQVASPKIILRP